MDKVGSLVGCGLELKFEGHDGAGVGEVGMLEVFHGVYSLRFFFSWKYWNSDVVFDCVKGESVRSGYA
jgi:hypothetical protein